MASTPRFLQGVFPFTGHGLSKPESIDPSTRFVVPSGATAQSLYFRGGNSSEELVVVTLLRDGQPMRMFPMGSKSGVNIALRVVEDVDPDSVLELVVAAPEGTTGEVVVDFGLVLI
ncbi:molybdopterin oxidoreductase [Rhodococcus sp. PAMC28707]|uniref:molybdopterin oxidoreductase n=1 Tax=unclassified Rhodococcus (in: high G+C Gram-positive bacteria) TaxID=192944 RepID=UPI00109DC710|nr:MULTISPECIES: molybdopterin oxidoreductase [unclassified Rhodococcus (in: high G+C Gram-positive bacteria)]QCB51139.1 molybdopterin oxidoreductase [Rhodococcus sp. PAMC28705]QCB57170.1 molybdopterin oxidoreductase [Rhodococcus sp. PAMC28707]